MKSSSLATLPPLSIPVRFQIPVSNVFEMLSDETLDSEVLPLVGKVINPEDETEEKSLQQLNPQERFVIEQIGNY